MKIAAAILILLGLGVFGYWGATGAHFATQYQVATKVVEEDEFGDKVEKTVMKDEFRFGLTPDKGYDGALPTGGPLLGLGVGLMIFGVIRDKKANAA